MLRSYQLDALAAIRNAFQQGVQRQAVVMSTGLGKTVIAAHLQETLKSLLPGRMLMIAHREELIDQAVRQIKKYNPALHVSKEMAEHHADENADVVVASVATLGRANSTRATRFDWNAFDKIVVDEMHHSAAQTYKNVLEISGALDPVQNKLLLGLTATPNRSDGEDLSGLYQRITYAYGLRDAIEDGWLVDLRGHRVQTETNLDAVKTNKADFVMESLAETVDTVQRNRAVADAWLQLGEGRQTLVFCATVAHAQHLATEFQAKGVKAAAVWGEDPLRAYKLQALRTGALNVLTNVAVMSEGFDMPSIACVIFARPTKSAVFFTQAVGRATRLQEGTGNLLEAIANGLQVKQDAVIIDMVDATSRHSLTTLPTLLGLNSGFDLEGKSLVKTKKAIDEIQLQHPTANFSDIRSLADLKLKIASVSLFDIKFPDVVLEHSSLSWFSHGEGYILCLPEKKSITIEPNMLGHWQCTSDIHGKRVIETETLEEAFNRCDAYVGKVAHKHIKVLVRESGWSDNPASERQIEALQKMYPDKELPADLSSGVASRLIGQKIAGFKKKELSEKQQNFLKKHYHLSDFSNISPGQAGRMIAEKVASWR